MHFICIKLLIFKQCSMLSTKIWGGKQICQTLHLKISKCNFFCTLATHRKLNAVKYGQVWMPSYKKHVVYEPKLCCRIKLLESNRLFSSIVKEYSFNDYLSCLRLGFFHEEFCEVNKVKNAQKLRNVLIAITTIKQYVTEATRI